MKLKIIILLVLLTQILTAQKGARIGYIDMDLILENIDEYNIAKKIIDQKIVVWKKEIELQKIQLKRYFLINYSEGGCNNQPIWK